MGLTGCSALGADRITKMTPAVKSVGQGQAQPGPPGSKQTGERPGPGGEETQAGDIT